MQVGYFKIQLAKRMSAVHNYLNAFFVSDVCSFANGNDLTHPIDHMRQLYGFGPGRHGIDELIDDGLSDEDISSKSEMWESAINKRYKKAGLSDGEGVTVLQKYDAVAKGIEIPEQDLLELTEARAVAVKGYLVNDAGMAPDRAVIAQGDIAAPENSFSGVELGL